MFFNQFFSKEVRKSEKNQAREEILIFKQEVMMKNKVILLTAMFLIGSFLTAQSTFSQPGSFLEQETYLFQKEAVENAPWNIILPLTAEIPYAKLEYLNYPVIDEANDDTIKGFYFDLKGYNIPINDDTNIFENGTYALVYYVDPDPEVEGPWNPDVYVLGLSEETKWISPARGWAKGHEEVNLKIDGVCGYVVDENLDPIYQDIDGNPQTVDEYGSIVRALVNIPVIDDVNWPNGGKVWLVPAKLINNGDELKACSWATMTSWNQSEILFETSLITFGFIAED
jgi:hypothetical protein